jgi:hypothetical protein
MAEKEIPCPDQSSLFGRMYLSRDAIGVGLKMNEYKIGDKTFFLQTDFTYSELEWLDGVYERLTPPAAAGLSEGKGLELHEIRGNFTRDEIEKTLTILLIPNSSPASSEEGKISPLGRGAGVGFTNEDFFNTNDSQFVKIIADFFINESSIRRFYGELFEELNKSETDADEEYNHLRGYRVSYFKGNPYLIPLLPQSGAGSGEEVLYQLMHGDPLLSEESKTKVKRMKILNYYYRSRVNRLNELLAGIEQLKQIEKSKN